MAQRTPPTEGPGRGSGAGSGPGGGLPGFPGADGEPTSAPAPAQGRDGAGEAAVVPLAARGPRPRVPDAPFVWQHDRRLLLLDGEWRGWTVAELRFDEARCRYVEVRRATYRWPREAAGALLARVVASGLAAAEETSAALHGWIAANRARGLPPEDFPRA